MTSKFQLIFFKFAHDVVSYALQKKGVEWNLDLPNIPQTFNSKVGDAALCYRKRHARKYENLLGELPNHIFQSEEGVEEYVGLNLDLIFGEEKIFLLQVLELCALMVDLALRCLEESNTNYLHIITDMFAQICYERMRAPLKILGGFQALNCFAEQYLEYRVIDDKQEMQSSSSSEITSFCAEKSDDSEHMDLEYSVIDKTVSFPIMNALTV